MTAEGPRAQAEDLPRAPGRARGRRGEYKPVPGDLPEVVERLLGAAEDVVAWYAITDGDMTKHDARGAMARLLEVMIETSSYLGGLT